VTPDQRHFGHDLQILDRRRELYQRAQNANPERWSRAARNWAPIDTVVLNPERVPRSVADQTTRQLP
jgi:putative transposase